ncbi:ankyrin repeat and SOCS box protein 15b [Electrophorus electricus]|uniref:ankyrin repeat and SOCS box protein 15b n=1 Tax=Electrophorus electricus TaxID=8005 RepID=UPI0015D04128|nr:ankyrin repeat and SOCS box protein 15b [Electrophorus electricus]
MMEFAVRQSLQEVCASGHQRADTSGTASDENLQILAAIDRGDVSALRALCAHASAFEVADPAGRFPFHRAAVQPDARLLDAVLLASHELSMEEVTGEGETALTLAAHAGCARNVEVLVRHGASPYNTNRMSESPLLLAVRAGSYDTVLALILGGAFVEQVCRAKWTATHEAARAGCADIMMLLLRHGGKVEARDVHGVTPLGIAAEFGHADVLEILIEHGGDVNAQATNGDTVLYDAAGSGNLDCVELLLQRGASPNVASLAFQLPIHRAAYQGHYLVLKTLIPLTTKRAIRLSGMSPVHSAADGGHASCLELLIQKGFDVNSPLGAHISDNYDDMRKTALFFTVSNGDVTCTQQLLEAGAGPDLDPLRCLLVAVRAGHYELVRLLLAYGANVNCFFTVVSDTMFPTALQYCLKDQSMLRMLLSNGYHGDSCFQCYHDQHYTGHVWGQNFSIQDTDNCSSKVMFCDFICVFWLRHMAGPVVRTIMDYVRHVPICSKLTKILERQKEWPEICHILCNPRSLQHLCRLVIREKMTLQRLNSPQVMNTVPFPPALKNYLTYKELDMYDSVTEA